MTDKPGKDDLFHQRMIPGFDFDECVEMFTLDIHEYLTAHSADFRQWDQAEADSSFTEELNRKQSKAFARLLTALCELEVVVTDRLWTIGMLAAVCSVKTQSFDVGAFLSAEVKAFKTKVYAEAVETLELEYDAVKETLPPRHHAPLAEFWKNQRQAIRMKAIAGALHGVEWTVQALKHVDLQVEESDLNKIYLFFNNL